MLDQAYSRRQFLGLAGGFASIVGLGLVGCGGSGASDAADKGSAAAAESVSGEVTYDGASSFQALVEAAAEKFMDANPDVSVSGSGNGSGKGLTAVAAGTVTIGNSDVFAETKLEADQVKNLVDHEVAVVGMGPVVSKNVTVDDLSLEQLKGIFSGQITNWKEVGGDDATIVVLNRKAGSGTRATFEAAVFGDEAVDFKGDAELDKSGDVQTQMGSTDNAISYLDFSHFDDSKFNAIKVEGVEPKSKNVTDDSFKIWATEHMYCSKDADENLTTVVERTEIMRVNGPVCYKDEQGEWVPVEDNTPVSMNMWGFTPDYFEHSEAYFKEFLSDPKNMENLKAEFFIPLMVNKLINEKTATVKVLDTTSKWFGVTYAADRQSVVDKIQSLIDEGVHPSKLF